MCCAPVGHYVALETEFALEDIVEYLAVLAAVGLVQSVIAAHHLGWAVLLVIDRELLISDALTVETPAFTAC